MSLENAIRENTEAVRALIAALQSTQTAAAPQPAASVKEEPKAKPAPKPAPAAKEEPKPEPTPEPAPQTAADEPKISLADLQKLGKKLMDAGKQPEFKAVIVSLGGTKLSLLPESDYPACLKGLQDACTAAGL